MTPDRPLVAALWMIGSIIAFTSMAVAGRAVSVSHDTFEIMFWRSLIGFGIVALVLTTLRRWPDVRRDRLGRHLVRNVAHFTGQNLWFWAITVIPLAQVFALEFTSPLWVILLAPVFLGERLTKVGAGAALLGFAGIMIVARPDFDNLNPGVVAAAAAAICFATVQITTKSLTRHDGILSIMFWLTLMQLGLGAAFVFHDGTTTLPDATSLPFLAMIACAGLIAHFCLTRALSLAPATTVIPVDFLRLPLIAVVGWLVYGEVIEPPVLIGAALIFTGIWINLRASGRTRLQQESVKEL